MRRYVNCRKKEAYQAKVDAFHATQKVLRLRRKMWRDVKALLLKEWVYFRRKQICFVLLSIIGDMAFLKVMYHLAILHARLMK